MNVSKLLLKALVVFSLLFLFEFNREKEKISPAKVEEYVCTPCGLDCDKIVYNKPGQCPHCHMPLVKKSTISFGTIQPNEICNYIKNHPNTVLLDVRSREEFEGKAKPDYGTLKNAINIPVDELEKRLPEINGLKNKEVLVYCSHSHRSSRSSYLLTQKGFTHIINMAGGMSVMTDKTCKK